MKKFANAACFLIIAITAALGWQFAQAPAAFAGSVPPPAACGAYPNYAVADSQCWGNAGNPPSGCLNGNVINTAQANCVVWKAALPVEESTIPTATAPPTFQLPPPTGLVVRLTDVNRCWNVSNDPNSPGSEAACPADTPDDFHGTISEVFPDGNHCRISDNIALFYYINCPSTAASPNTPNLPTTTDAVIRFTDLNRCYTQDGGPDNPGHEVQCPPESGGDIKTNIAGAVKDGANCKVFDGTAVFLYIPCPVATNTAPPPATNGDNTPPPPVTGGADSAVPGGTSSTPIVPVDAKNIFTLTNGLEFFALVAAVGSMFISSAMWVLGSKGNNEHQQMAGKKGFVVALTAAFLIGALPAIFDWSNAQARKADDTTSTQQPGSSVQLGGAPAAGGLKAQ